MEVTKFNNKNYYSAIDVYNAEPARFPNCSKTVRHIVKAKGLKEDEYIYLKEDNDKNLVESTPNYSRAKLFLRKKWVEENLTQFKKVKTDEDKKLEAMKAPPLLILKNEEKFHDADGNVLEVEMRGERNIDKIYFKVKDIEDKFQIKNIATIILNKDSSFNEYIDYKNFNSNTIVKPELITSKKSGNPKVLYLTYLGLTRLLFVSRSKNAEHFQKWAVQKLFTIQMGSPEEKILLADKLLGMPYKIVKEALKTNICPISCVYLFTLGTVEQLRKSLNIPEKYLNNWIVVKYGKTDNLERRTGEHNITFSVFEGVELRLKHYAHVDSNYITDAENDISEYIKNSKYDYQFGTFEEIAIIPKDNMKSLTKKYEDIRKLYAGTMGEIIREKENLLNQVEKLKMEVENKDNIIEMIKQLNAKDMENKDLKIENLELKLSIKGKK
jgi:hypothetical protein